jgi:hypothetical protein
MILKGFRVLNSSCSGLDVKWYFYAGIQICLCLFFTAMQKSGKGKKPTGFRRVSSIQKKYAILSHSDSSPAVSGMEHVNV